MKFDMSRTVYLNNSIYRERTRVFSHILRRFGGGVSRGLEDAFDELSVLCLVGLFGGLFGPSRLDSDSLRSFLMTTTINEEKSKKY